MLPFISIFGVAIAFPPLILITGIWVGASLAEKHAAKHKISGQLLFNLIFTGLAAYLIGGRLSYALQNPSAFADNLLSLISRNFGLFDPMGGIVVGLIASIIYGQRKKLPLWPTLDALTPALALFMLAIPLANLASGNAFGAPSDLPWAIELWGMTRHPVQIYEALAAGLILWSVWPGRPRVKIAQGLIFTKFVGMSTLARLVFEGFRGNSLVITSFNLRIAQVIAWLVLVIAVWVYQSRRAAEE
jgi:prolipoprotein diacylglyceryltransferase